FSFIIGFWGSKILAPAPFINSIPKTKSILYLLFGLSGEFGSLLFFVILSSEVQLIMLHKLNTIKTIFFILNILKLWNYIYYHRTIIIKPLMIGTVVYSITIYIKTNYIIIIN